MFEQSVLPATQTNTRAAFAAVTAAELLGIAGAMVIPLFLIGRPTVPKLPVLMRFQPRHVELVAVNPERTAAQAPVRRVLDFQRLVAPVKVPSRVMDLRDIAAPDPGMIFSEATSGTGTDVVGAPAARTSLPPPPLPAHQSAAQPAHPMRVSQGVQEAKLVKRVMPVYPEIARSIRQFGT